MWLEEEERVDSLSLPLTHAGLTGFFELFAECSHARLPTVYCTPLYF